MKLNYFLLILGMFLISFASASDLVFNDYTMENGVILFENTSNTTIQINQDTSASVWNISSNYGGLIITNLATTPASFTNINDTYDAKLKIINLTNKLVYFSNGTLYNANYTGDVEVTFAPSVSLVIDEPQITVDVPNGNSGSGGINQDGGSGDTKIDNPINSTSVLIQITGLSNSFIYFSNGTILTYQIGNLNINLQGNEYFYIVSFSQLNKFNENNGTIAYDSSGNSNHGTISGATWQNDGVLVTLVNGVDYTLNAATGLLTLNSRYVYDWVMSSWDYGQKGNGSATVVGRLIPLFVVLIILAFIFLIINYYVKELR